jgi:hypothetical protein
MKTFPPTHADFFEKATLMFKEMTLTGWKGGGLAIPGD